VNISNLEIPDVKLIQPKVYRDTRGFFLESYSAPLFKAAGIDLAFVQDNHSRSVQGTLRGLHYQSSPGQAKLVRVVAGRIWDVAVDIRPTSPTFGKWVSVYLDSESHGQILVPVGFAHGFCVMSEYADVVYKVSAPYDAKTECSIRFDDPELAVSWPVAEPLVSERDRTAGSFADYRKRMVAG
jgi:dTDP-4-dehydrorhamnose 3,5-epimerase